MRLLIANLIWGICVLYGPSLITANEAEMRSSPKVTICDDTMPPPLDECHELDGPPLLQVRYPKEMKTGFFTTWTVERPPWDSLVLVTERNDQNTSLWGRIEHDDKLIIIKVADIMVYGPYRGYTIRMDITWRARSLSNGLVLVDDAAMTGDIIFFFDSEDPKRKDRIELTLGGAGMAMASWLEGKFKHEHDEISERTALEKIRLEWEAMGSETRKANLKKVVSHWGIIRDYQKDEL